VELVKAQVDYPKSLEDYVIQVITPNYRKGGKAFPPQLKEVGVSMP